MEPEDLQPKRVPEALALLARDDLSLFGVDELNARITLLKAEIARSEAELASKAGSLSAAEAVFRK